MHDVSLLIPLYRSNRFFDVVCENIRTVLLQGGSVIVSDQERGDDCIERLQAKFGQEPRFLALDEAEAGNWVSNINRLIRSVRTDFFRVVPHDDSASAQSNTALRAQLVAHPDAVLCFGPVVAIDLAGARLPELDQSNAHYEGLETEPWNIDAFSDLFWSGRFGGAFKGMVRRSAIEAHDLLIRETPRLEHSERAWLFALALTGRFVFARDGILTKRYYADSTHKSWAFGARERADTTALMRSYVRDLVHDPLIRAALDGRLVHYQIEADGPDSLYPLP